MTTFLPILAIAFSMQAIKIPGLTEEPASKARAQPQAEARAEARAPSTPSGVYAFVTPQLLAGVFKELGFEPQPASSGEKFKIEMDDSPVVVDFFLCEKEGCEGYGFQSGFGLPPARLPTIEQVQQWNHDKRLTRAYVTEKAVWLHMDVLAGGGVTRENLKMWVRYWQALRRDFMRRIGVLGGK